MVVSPSKFLLLALVAGAGCATAAEQGNGDNPDARVNPNQPDARVNPNQPDAQVNPNQPDARPAPDGMTSSPDAMCTVQTMQLLANPAFDGSPAGTGWTQQPTNASFPLIVPPPSGLTAPTSPDIAWLGGLDSANDILFQDVAVPAGTTALTLTGTERITTAESLGVAFDDVTVTIKNTSGTTLATLLALDNLDANAAFTTFSQNAPQSFAGQTIRVHFLATTDGSDPTNFFFDSLALNATVCQ